MKKTFIIAAAAALLSAGCTPKGTSAIRLEDMDLSVKASEDFYLYANGGWKANNPLKGEYASFGAFDFINENNIERLNDLFASMTDMKTAKGSVEQKIVDLYQQGLDSVRLNSEGAAPLKAGIQKILSVRSKEDFTAIIADLHSKGIEPFFGTGVMADLMDSDSQVLYFGQSGLGIGNRDYYLDVENADIRKGYIEFLERISTLAGLDNPSSVAQNAIRVEDALARISWSNLENRDMLRLYNPMSTQELCSAFPGFDFEEYLALRGIPAQELVVVEQLSYFEHLSELYASLTEAQLRDYLLTQYIADGCGALSDDFYDASFRFYSAQMSGVKEKKPRWKRAMSVPNGILGEAVGKMYVAKYFPPSYKKKVLSIVNDLKESLSQHIAGLDWMGDTTKAYAQEKLANFTVKIGYPDKWKDYSDLAIDPSLSYFENLTAASEWYVRDNLNDLGKPTDRSRWGMTPQTVNAYYDPTTNEICFPAAILQPPFFDPEADDAVNYGAIGVVIGHEMTHGFDDQGRLFDKNGNMVTWWTDSDDAAFKAKSEVLVHQYSEAEVLPGVKADGELTLGENIADHGGLSIAYTALHNSFGVRVPAPVDGFTADQRFYLGYARLWAENSTDEDLAKMNKFDVHSASFNRVNVALRNFQTFFDAFGIKEGDRMYRPEEERVKIW